MIVFSSKIEEYAESRPYNKLQPRTSIISKMDRNNAQLYFFDALGVEYLAYIMFLCERYEMVAEISIGHCELPSITSKNKDFLHFFPNGARDIKDLDELKHHSQVIDYQQCKVPVHLFRELEIIDLELRKIRSCLMQGQFDKAVIVSDHGASRLAVINEQENELLELEEKCEHSGRCCPAESDPKIPYASYENGYSILANYDRFKGSRKANVEVHGGATLEEVLVPIIVLTKKPADTDICFVDSLIKLKGKESATIVVFSNIPLHAPKLLVNGVCYEGEFEGDSRHAKFVMPELKRSKNWTADFYDGDKKLARDMEFRVQKGDTQEKDFFGKKKFTL
ncbi:MAG: BREX-4 system phosphatase PglZ [Lachnospiraceae bacterium]|nr:BREX-4 system phosphatase PglZ [Lachnospiraceae bacterium]